MMGRLFFVAQPLPSMPSALRLLLIAGLFVLLSGCVSSGAFLSGHLTDVQLSQANYELLATDVSGSATAGYLLGFSGGFGLGTQAFALARVSGDDNLYQTALAALWADVRSQHGDLEGRNLALVNVRYDVDALNLILYTQPTLTVRADVVEFVE